MQEGNYELKKLGNRIKQLRMKQKLTMRALAYRNGLDPSSISRLERGLVEPKYLSLLLVAKSLKMDLSEMLKF